MTDAQLMKSTRKALGLTQTEMAKKLGYAHQQSISYIELGAANLVGPARIALQCIRKNETNNQT